MQFWAPLEPFILASPWPSSMRLVSIVWLFPRLLARYPCTLHPLTSHNKRMYYHIRQGDTIQRGRYSGRKSTRERWKTWRRDREPFRHTRKGTFGFVCSSTVRVLGSLLLNAEPLSLPSQLSLHSYLVCGDLFPYSLSHPNPRQEETCPNVNVTSS